MQNQTLNNRRTPVITNDKLNHLSPAELCAILALFIRTKLFYTRHDKDTNYISDIVTETMSWIVDRRDAYEMRDYGQCCDWELNCDGCQYMYTWAQGKCTFDAKFNSVWYISDFIKDVLMLDNLITTLEHICHDTMDFILLKKLGSIHSLLIRDVVTNESLYLI